MVESRENRTSGNDTRPDDNTYPVKKSTTKRNRTGKIGGMALLGALIYLALLSSSLWLMFWLCLQASSGAVRQPRVNNTEIRMKK
jgi:hypothetical protein